MTKTEFAVKNAYEREGFQVLHQGWPDFLVVQTAFRHPVYPERAGRMAAIEVKSGACPLTPEQKTVHKLLRRYGFPVYTIRLATEWDRVPIVPFQMLSAGRALYGILPRVRNLQAFVQEALTAEPILLGRPPKEAGINWQKLHQAARALESCRAQVQTMIFNGPKNLW